MPVTSSSDPSVKFYNHFDFSKSFRNKIRYVVLFKNLDKISI